MPPSPIILSRFTIDRSLITHDVHLLISSASHIQSFPDFLSLWKTFDFSLIHFSCTKTRTPFYNALFSSLLPFLHSFPLQVIYAFYCLFYSHPTSIYSQVYIRIDKQHWEILKSAYSQFPPVKPYIKRLLQDNAFLFVATIQQATLSPSRSEENIKEELVGLANEFQETKQINLIDPTLVELVREYEESKRLESSNNDSGFAVQELHLLQEMNLILNEYNGPQSDATPPQTPPNKRRRLELGDSFYSPQYTPAYITTSSPTFRKSQ